MGGGTSDSESSWDKLRAINTDIKGDGEITIRYKDELLDGWAEEKYRHTGDASGSVVILAIPGTIYIRKYMPSSIGNAALKVTLDGDLLLLEEVLTDELE